MIKQYLVVSYAILVRSGVYLLEPIDGDERPVVPTNYVLPVAEYLANHV
ncbi:MAG: hypothetical protein K0S61_118 [Anaerocolumna sp.]|jgi:hypothetical protein|nr:hypothetical protein [Anaerocolumna sp.]